MGFPVRALSETSMTLKPDNRPARSFGPRRTPSQPQPRAQSGQNQWQRNYERYQALAASSDSDPVARENYWQHAEHFLRMMRGNNGVD